MMLESDEKFEEKVTCGLENDMKSLANFHQSTQSFKIVTFIGSFYQKQKMYELKIYEGVIRYDYEE